MGNIYQWGKPEAGDRPVIHLDTTGMSTEAKRFLASLGPLDARGWMSLFSHAPVEGWPAGEIIERAYHNSQITALIPIDRVGMLTDINPDGLYLKKED
jgi:hypothetical protein